MTQFQMLLCLLEMVFRIIEIGGGKSLRTRFPSRLDRLAGVTHLLNGRAGTSGQYTE